MPVFEGLLPPEDDETVADMLFELSNWHALAKLRMQHDVTLENLDLATSHMYATIRTFAQTTCEKYTTHELPAESDARARRQRAKQTSSASKGKGKAVSNRDASAGPPADPADDAAVSTSRRVVRFTVMESIKYHALGDYVDYIRRSGPTDNTSTQCVRWFLRSVWYSCSYSRQGECEHKHCKGIFKRTNKVHCVRQIARRSRNTSMLSAWRPRDSYVPPTLRKQAAKRQRVAAAESHERAGTFPSPASSISPSEHHHISKAQRAPISLRQWIGQHAGDAALQVRVAGAPF